MKCGNCGSGISAQEKYKELSNGHTAKYIYYGCSRSQDLNCKERNIREKELIKQISSIIDEIDLEEAGLKQRLISEVKKYYKFQNIFGEGKEKLR
ncbi:MAG: zinc ribbon domain-containing protein [Candidatus Magasanikbacteria bacterium]